MIQTASTFFQNFGISNRYDKLKVIEDFQKGNSLSYFKQAYIDDQIVADTQIDWKKRYKSSNYLNLVNTQFIEFIPNLTRIKGIKTKSEKQIQAKEKLKNDWLEYINWRSLLKNIALRRRNCGDVYLHWWLEETPDGKIYPRLKLLDSKNMEIMVDEDDNIMNYVYTFSYTHQIKTMPTVNNRVNTLAPPVFHDETDEIKMVFNIGSTDIYENGTYKESRISKIDYADEFQLLHLQFLEEPDTKYSQIPNENIIDLCLRLDKLETQLSDTNSLSGSPQMIVIDGLVDVENSGFGANGIVYVNTKSSLDTGQARVEQLMITNGLESMFKEQLNLLNILYDRANLIRPTMLEKLSTSDSSRVIASIRLNLENEIEDLLNEVINKTPILLKALFTENNMLSSNEVITFEMPESIIDNSVFDRYLLKTQKLAVGDTTMREEWIKQGMTNEEISFREKNINNEMYGGKNDISILPDTATPAPIPVTISNSSDVKPVSLDNQFKQNTNVKSNNGNHTGQLKNNNN